MSSILAELFTDVQRSLNFHLLRSVSCNLALAVVFSMGPADPPWSRMDPVSVVLKSPHNMTLLDLSLSKVLSSVRTS